MTDPWEQAAKEFNAGRTQPAASQPLKISSPTGAPPREPTPAEADAWKVWQQSGSPSDAAGKLRNEGFLESAWNGVKGALNLPAAMLHTDAASDEDIDLGRKMVERYRDPTPLTPEQRKETRDEAISAIPGGSTAIKVREGNISGALGDVAGVAAVGAVAKGATAAPKLWKVDPRIATTRALRPVPSDPGFPKRIPQTLKMVLDANGGEIPKGITDGTLDVLPAAQKAIGAHQDVLQQWIDRAGHVKIDGGPIVQATAQATQGMLPSEAASAQGLIQRAMKDYGSEFTPQELRDRLRLLNERLSPFYDKSPAKQSTALADIPEAVLKAQRDAVAETLYRALDPENAGAGPRTVQTRTGDLIDLRDAAQRRNNAIVAEQPLTPLGKIVDPVKGFIRSVLPGKATGSGIAFAEGSEGRSLPMLKRSFKAVRDEQVPDLPRPQGLYPTGNPTRQLPAPNMPGRMGPAPGPTPEVWGNDPWEPIQRAGEVPVDRTGTPFETVGGPGGTMYTPPPADTSSVRAVPGMAQPPNPARAIGPGRGTIVPPYEPPQPQMNVTTGEPLRMPTSRQLPAGSSPSSRTPAAVDAIGSRAGDVTDLVPSINPETGEVEYVPRQQRPSPPLRAPKFAKGGIAGLHGPEQIIVGDGDGPEAVVPLGSRPPALGTPGGKEERHFINVLRNKARQIRPPRLQTPRAKR